MWDGDIYYVGGLFIQNISSTVIYNFICKQFVVLKLKILHWTYTVIALEFFLKLEILVFYRTSPTMVLYSFTMNMHLLYIFLVQSISLKIK